MGEILRIAGRHALTAEEKQLSSLRIQARGRREGLPA